MGRNTPTLEEFSLFLLACQPVQHCAAAPWGERILVKRRPGFAQGSQPALPFRTKLGLQLPAKALRESSAVAGLGHEDFGTTMRLYTQSDMESMRDAQGKFLEQLVGDRIHRLTATVQ